MLDDIPSGAPPGAPGGVYFANTKRSFQEQGWLRQGWVRGEDIFGVKGAGIVVGASSGVTGSRRRRATRTFSGSSSSASRSV